MWKQVLIVTDAVVNYRLSDSLEMRTYNGHFVSLWGKRRGGAVKERSGFNGSSAGNRQPPFHSAYRGGHYLCITHGPDTEQSKSELQESTQTRPRHQHRPPHQVLITNLYTSCSDQFWSSRTSTNQETGWFVTVTTTTLPRMPLFTRTTSDKIVER